jgi:glycosyltransferase involved in cell wall biosynthesis
MFVGKTRWLHAMLARDGTGRVKVLYVIDSLARSGGAEQSLLAMAPHLVRAGVELDVAYLVERDGLAEALRGAGATVTKVPGGGRAARVAGVRRLVARSRPDLVHTTLFEADVVGRIASVLTRTPVVSSLVNASYGPEHVGDPRLRAWRVRTAQALDAGTAQVVRRFHAISGHVADTMAARLHVPRHRIDVVSRGRDPDLLGLRTAERAEKARRELGVPLNGPVVVAAARHERQKGLDVLVDAFSLVLADCPDARLVIAGRTGNATAELEAIVDRRRLAGRVQLLGARSDVADIIAAADAFVVPSRWEGLGSVLLEAMALEAPIVASRLPAIQETLGFETAVLVPPGHAAALAAAIVVTLTDTAGAQTRGRRARERFLAHFTVDRVSAEMIAFYDRALAAPR